MSELVPKKKLSDHVVALQTAGDPKLLSEFRYACDIWLAYMSEAGKAEALAYVAKVGEKNG